MNPITLTEAQFDSVPPDFKDVENGVAYLLVIDCDSKDRTPEWRPANIVPEPAGA